MSRPIHGIDTKTRLLYKIVNNSFKIKNSQLQGGYYGRKQYQGNS